MREQRQPETHVLSLEVEELEERIAPGLVANPMAPAHAGPAAGPILTQVAPVWVQNWFGAASGRC